MVVPVHIPVHVAARSPILMHRAVSASMLVHLAVHSASVVMPITWALVVLRSTVHAAAARAVFTLWASAMLWSAIIMRSTAHVHLWTWSRAAMISPHIAMVVPVVISAVINTAVIRANRHGTAFSATSNLFTRHGSAAIADVVIATIHHAIAAILHAFTKLLHALPQLLPLGGRERITLARSVRAALIIRARARFASVGFTRTPIVHLTIWAIVAVRASSPTVVHAAIIRLLIHIARGLESLIGTLVCGLANGDGRAGGVIVVWCSLGKSSRLQSGKECCRGNQASRMRGPDEDSKPTRRRHEILHFIRVARHGLNA
jgi:hypothetical protein